MATYNISKLNEMGRNPQYGTNRKSKFPKISKTEVEQLLGILPLDIESRSIIQFILEKKRFECKQDGIFRLEEILSEKKLKEEDAKILQGFKSLFLDEYNSYTTEKAWKDIPKTKTSGLASPFMEDYFPTPPKVYDPYRGIQLSSTADRYSQPKKPKKNSQIERLEEMIANGQLKIPTPPKSKKIGNVFENVGSFVGRLFKSENGSDSYWTDMKNFANLNKKKLDLTSEKSTDEYQGKSVWKRLKF